MNIMRRILLFVGIVVFMTSTTFAQRSKAEIKAAKKAAEEAELNAKFNKALAAIDARDFVIVVEQYRSNATGTTTITVDKTNFFSYEKQFAYVQGAVFFGQSYPDSHKLDVSDFSKEVDKKGNVIVKMFVRGSLTEGRVEINLHKGDNYADVIYKMRGFEVRYSGEVVPTAESDYFKRVTKI
jgi:hypothetical protein